MCYFYEVIMMWPVLVVSLVVVIFDAWATDPVLYGDVGCKNSYALGRYGKCVDMGCCLGSGQDSSTSLCSGGGSTETCCYREYTCGSLGCINVVGTWISRYNYHADYESIDNGMRILAQKHINRVYFNIWADGNLYAESATARANSVTMAGDRLAIAVERAKFYGLEIYAWFEYGTQAAYGSLNAFATASASKGWLLCHNPSTGCDNYFAGSYAYLDLRQSTVVNFLGGMVADLISGYPDLDGFQFDDHLSLPNDFNSISSLPVATRYSTTRSAMINIRDMARAERSGVHVSFSPSPLTFARDNHNVDWANYLADGVIMEVVPQYYRTSYTAFVDTLEEDLARVSQTENGMVTGIRLSGSGADTPHTDVTQMINYCYTKKLRGVSFWFADDIISDSGYNPAPFTHC